ncbi:MAG TPA: myxosortase-dependent metalloprotease, MXAN_2677/MXAN_2678 family [Myxococcaceae bacterium]|nr:myxosortase-dependent metalloprotease, MXAN_2677/MXAN_2678 family [Myxococcaceae bacterium]
MHRFSRRRRLPALGLAAAMLAWAAPAGAQDYFRSRSEKDANTCLHWAERTYVYSVDRAGSGRTPDDDEVGAVDASFQAWRTVAGACSDFRFIKGNTPDAIFIGYRARESNQNVVTFRERSCEGVVPANDPCRNDDVGTSCRNAYQCWDDDSGTIALTTITYNKTTGVIFDADIEFNAANFLFTAVDSPPCPDGVPSGQCVATDIRNTLTHEIGHAVGFDHVGNPGSTMEPSAVPGETSKRVVDTGTSDGFCAVYPRNVATPSCSSSVATYRVVAESEGTAAFEDWGCGAAGRGMPSAFGMVGAGLWLWRRRRA